PENFPMDRVMFTGRLPLERFREERPDEYERLVREGKLDAILTEAPTPQQIRFAQWFGFITLGIGVILIVAIYASFLARFFMR
ncbi:MAG: cytochrome b/b6 domain-containing protein, partial [Thermoanaerobaculia bacterium]